MERERWGVEDNREKERERWRRRRKEGGYVKVCDSMTHHHPTHRKKITENTSRMEIYSQKK